MSSEPQMENKEVEGEKKQETEAINNINTTESKEEEKNEEKEEIQNTETNFKIADDLEKVEPKNQIINKYITNDNKNIDHSTLVLSNKEFPENSIVNQLNNQNSNGEIIKQKENANQSFIQRTKSWMSNMWTNVKNYDYGKYNIFKKTEMEDCIDAHGNHIKIPKNTNKKEIHRKKENNEDFKKYNNLNYNRYYYTNSNANVFAGYPF